MASQRNVLQPLGMKSLMLLLPALALLGLGFEAEANPGPANPAPPDEVQLNKALSRELSERLSDELVVYETDLFQIIASKSYEKRLVRDVNERVPQAVAEFRNLFQVGRDQALWKGKEKGRLVLIKSRKTFRYYIQIFKKEAEPERLNPDFVIEVQDAQSFYWVDPWPYAVCCGEGAEFEEMTRHLFHLLGHILITCLDFNYKFTPAWLHEGYGIHLAVRHAGGNILYCTQGLNNCLFGTGVFKGLSAWARSENWPGYFRQEKYRKSALRLEELNRLPINEFDHQDAALSWSFVTFLLETRPDPLRSYVKALKKQPRDLQPGSYWPPPEFSAETFREAFKMTFQEIEPLWADWAETYDERNHPVSGTGEAPPAEAGIKFDPAEHLEGFADLEGTEVSGELAPFVKRTDEWLSPEALEALRAEWEAVRGRLLEELERRKNDRLTKPVPGLEKTLAELRIAKEARFLEMGEVTKLILPGESLEVFRAVVVYLARSLGCQGAWSRLREAFLDEGAAAGSGPFEEETSLLEEASRLEARLFKDLAAAKTSFPVDFWPSKVTLVSAEEGRLVLRSRKSDGDNPAPNHGFESLRVREEGKDVEIQCPCSYVDLKTLLTLGKSALKLKSEKDRLGYLLLCLFQGDEENYRKEARFIKESEEEIARLDRLLPGYAGARPGAELIDLLAGGLERPSGQGIDALSSVLAETRGSVLYQRLVSRCRSIAHRVLLEQYLHENRFLRGFKGFRGMADDAGTARFVYEFDDPAELQDFEPLRGRFLDSLKVRYKVEPTLVKGPFAVEKGALACNGMDALILKPVFDGDMELVVRLKLSRMEGEDSRRFFFTLFGYGLNPQGAFVASNCLTRVEIQTPSERVYEMLEAGPDEPILGRDETCAVYLKGDSGRIVHNFNDTERWVFERDGRRKGRVFLWVYGPWRFEIELLEVLAKIDPLWLEQAMEEAVMAELRGSGLAF